MLANVCTGAIKGIEGFAVSVEVDIAAGMPTLAVVGLPDAEVRESKERVVAAVRNSGFDFPAKRITVNLSPAELRKSGTQFDVPIALGILAASGQLSEEAREKISRFLVHFLKELLAQEMYFPYFKEYADNIAFMRQFADKTMVQYKTSEGNRAIIHYLVEKDEGEYLRETVYSFLWRKNAVLHYGDRRG